MYKRIWRSLAVLFVSILFLLPAATVLADSYDVSATVPAPLPPDLPVITTPNNSTVSGPTVEVYGTCIIIDPSLIVVLERNGVPIGSGTCSDQGTFQITIALVLGTNIINVKFMTITGASGGYGTPLTILYAPPTPATTVTAVTPVPIQKPVEPLVIKLDYNFVKYTTTQVTPVTISVSGGTPPYTIFVGWGDNSSKTLVLDGPDTFVLNHLYRNVPGQSMKLFIRVTDANGVVTESERALVTFEKQSSAGPVKPTPAHTSNMAIGIWFTATAGTMLVAALSYNAHFAANAASSIVKGSHLRPKKISMRLKPRGKP